MPESVQFAKSIKMQFNTPSEIEKESMRIIADELQRRGCDFPEDELPIIMRAIHTTADFDYSENLVFTDNAVKRAKEALRAGIPIITDTNMALSGINKKIPEKQGCSLQCFMAEPGIAKDAERNGVTRAYASMSYAASHYENAAFAIGNAPTALIRLCELMDEGYRPAFIIAVPVGFVNVVESKEMILSSCKTHDIPLIVSMGNKGGSTVAAGIMNAILYTATRWE